MIIHDPRYTLAHLREALRWSLFLTPFGIRECAQLTVPDIEAVFGSAAADFWSHVRSGSIRITKPATTKGELP